MAVEPLKPLPREAQPPPIPGYELEGEIGRGATGIVWRARQLTVDRLVALKVLLPELSARSNIVRRLQREARTTARLAHPHIVSAIDMGETDGRWWYAMELVDGPSLAERLRHEGRLKEREALRLFIPLCEALEHLHEHGVVHRDIKPANILIDKNGGARLADLGLACVEDDHEITAQGGTLGTPHYISPEQAVDPLRADVRSDLWSFGATLFHTICGRPPFLGESSAEILSNVLYARIPDPLELEPSLSKGFALVLRKCLTREPAARYQAPHELLLDLERVRERRTPRVSPSQLDPVERRGPSRSSWLLIGGGALAALALAVWVLVDFDGSPRSQADPSVGGPPTYAPLEQAARRADGHPEHLAQALSELAALRPALEARMDARWRELDAELRRALREEVFALRKVVEGEVRAKTESKDLAAAWETLRSIDGRLIERTGFGPAELEREGVGVLSWSQALTSELEARTRTALSGLELALAAWSERATAQAEELVQARDFAKARALLTPDDTTLLVAAGFERFRFPEDRLQLVFVALRTELRGRRLARVDEPWLALDRELAGWVEERAAELSTRLVERALRGGAAQALAQAFERELVARRMHRAGLPTDLPCTALEALERARGELTVAEDGLARADLLRTLENTERLCDERLGPSRRDYAGALALWNEARAEAQVLAADRAAPWLEEASQRIEGGRAEAGLLEGLLERAADRILAQDGALVSLRIGSVLYADRRLVAGSDPRVDGFRLEGTAEVFDLQTLATSDLENLAGFGAEGVLEPLERLALALFRLREGRLDAARRALRAGSLPLAGVEAQLARDLEGRIDRAAAQADATLRSRVARAEEDLRFVLDPENQARVPHRVSALSAELLDKHADLASVRAHKAELSTLRTLGLAPPLGDLGQRLRERYDPSQLDLSQPGRVRMTLHLERARLPGLSAGEWAFDGEGWSVAACATGYDDLFVKRPLGLILEPPLDAEKGSFELALTVEQPPDSEEPKLFVVSAFGFHVLLAGAGLPGGPQKPRWLVATGDWVAALQGLRAGEGLDAKSLLSNGRTHELLLRGSRASGRLTLLLDGAQLFEVQRSPPDGGADTIHLRSWEPVRLRTLTLEVGR
jgi:serine/threonine-protein kinase